MREYNNNKQREQPDNAPQKQNSQHSLNPGNQNPNNSGQYRQTNSQSNDRRSSLGPALQSNRNGINSLQLDEVPEDVSNENLALS